MSFFTFFRTDDNPFGRIVLKERIEGIRDEWMKRCNDIMQPLSKKAIKELEKRVNNTKPGQYGQLKPGDKSKVVAIGGKPKLDLSGCEINDKQLKLLLTILSTRPSIQYLGLSYNDISDEVRLSLLCFDTQQCSRTQISAAFA